MLNFVPDKTVDNFLSSSLTVGTISTEESSNGVSISVPGIAFTVSSPKLSQASAAGYQSPGNTKPISEIQPQKCFKYSVRLRDDKCDCDITALAVTLGGKRLLADCDGNKIKMFSRDMKSLSSLSLLAPPLDIAFTGDEDAVVSVYGDSKLFILDVSEQQMSIRFTLKLYFKVCGIAKYKDKLIVISPSPPSIKLIDLSGKDYWSTYTNQQGQELFSRPLYVTCYDDGRSSTVIARDPSNNTLTLLNSSTGDVICRRHVVGKRPYDVITDTAGNIYVCYGWTREVAVLSEDLTEEKILLTQRDGLSGDPLAIAYDAEDHQLLVLYLGINDVNCFQLL